MPEIQQKAAAGLRRLDPVGRWLDGDFTLVLNSGHGPALRADDLAVAAVDLREEVLLARANPHPAAPAPPPLSKTITPPPGAPGAAARASASSSPAAAFASAFDLTIPVTDAKGLSRSDTPPASVTILFPETPLPPLSLQVDPRATTVGDLKGEVVRHRFPRRDARDFVLKREGGGVVGAESVPMHSMGMADGARFECARSGAFGRRSESRGSAASRKTSKVSRATSGASFDAATDRPHTPSHLWRQPPPVDPAADRPAVFPANPPFPAEAPLQVVHRLGHSGGNHPAPPGRANRGGSHAPDVRKGGLTHEEPRDRTHPVPEGSHKPGHKAGRHGGEVVPVADRRDPQTRGKRAAAATRTPLAPIDANAPSPLLLAMPQRGGGLRSPGAGVRTPAAAAEKTPPPPPPAALVVVSAHDGSEYRFPNLGPAAPVARVKKLLARAVGCAAGGLRLFSPTGAEPHDSLPLGKAGLLAAGAPATFTVAGTAELSPAAEAAAQPETPPSLNAWGAPLRRSRTDPSFDGRLSSSSPSCTPAPPDPQRQASRDPHRPFAGWEEMRRTLETVLQMQVASTEAVEDLRRAMAARQASPLKGPKHGADGGTRAISSTRPFEARSCTTTPPTASPLTGSKHGADGAAAASSTYPFQARSCATTTPPASPRAAGPLAPCSIRARSLPGSPPPEKAGGGVAKLYETAYLSEVRCRGSPENTYLALDATASPRTLKTIQRMEAARLADMLERRMGIEYKPLDGLASNSDLPADLFWGRDTRRCADGLQDSRGLTPC
ncbi:hypothetical protein DIPPA_06300 [Diplonema papillatum]|nr:hypothetical protein DIPPA_06300 [Diplonema papillatum]